jgi:hypothetical protein
MAANFPTPAAAGEQWTDPATGIVWEWDGVKWLLVVSAGAAGGASVTTDDAPPASPVDGDLWWNSELGILFVWYDDGDSGQWVEASPGTPVDTSNFVKKTGDTMTGPLVVPSATAGNQALNQDTADSRYVNVTGDTMAGPLVVPNATATNQALNADSADTRYVNVTGDTMSGALGLPRGSAAAPSAYFDGGTGLYSPGEDALALATGGLDRAQVDAAGRLLVGVPTGTGAAILQVQTPAALTAASDAGVAFENTSTKTYPVSPFNVTAGLAQTQELGNSAAVTSGNNVIAGTRFAWTKSAGNTQDIGSLNFNGLVNSFEWNDLNTCSQYFGIDNSFTYNGINASARTSLNFTGSSNVIRLNCPNAQTQTAAYVTPSTNYFSINPAGSSTVNVTNSQGESLTLFNVTAGTKVVNIGTHTFFGTYVNGWGTNSFSTPGTLTATITNLYGLRLRPPTTSAGATLTVTNNWGLYQEWSSAKNWFAGASNQFPGITTTASGANAFLDSANSNRLYRSTSSLAYKRDIEDLDGKLADQVLDLRPVWYRSKCAADCPDWSWYGFIAEEVAEIDPRFVHFGYQEDAYEFVEVTETVDLPPDDPRREEGIETEEVKRQERRLKADAQRVPNGVAYERLVVPLLDIIKRQKSQLESFEARLTALEAI